MHPLAAFFFFFPPSPENSDPLPSAKRFELAYRDPKISLSPSSLSLHEARTLSPILDLQLFFLLHAGQV